LTTRAGFQAGFYGYCQFMGLEGAPTVSCTLMES